MEKKTVTEEMENLYPDYAEELTRVIHSGRSPKAMEDAILQFHENDIAATMETWTPAERKILYQTLPEEDLASIFGYLDDVAPYFAELGIRKKVAILAGMEADDAVKCLRQLSKEERNTLIDLMDDQSRREICFLSSFDEDEVGSIMTTNFVSIPANSGVRQAMRSVIDQAADHDNITTIYVTAADGTYYGAITLQELIIARDGEPLEPLIATSYPYVYAEDPVEDCIERIKGYSETSIPVLSGDNRLIGVIMATDFVSVVEDAMGDDYAKLGGLSAEEDLHEPTRVSMKKRLPWLMVLLGLALVVSLVVGLFEKVVAQLTLVICFQSLVLDMAGNVGTQSLAVTIRVLMDEQLSAKQKWTLVWKEGKIGAANGLLIGTLAFAFVGLYIHLLKGQSWGVSYAISGCIGAALLVSMWISSLAGTTIPLAFKKMGVDPAVASGPLITTINDLVAVVAYYGLTWVLLLGVLDITKYIV